MFSKLLLTQLLLTNQAFCQEFESYAGAMLDEELDTGAARAPSVRHGTQTKLMLEAVVCAGDPNCPFTAQDFFLAIRFYGCNCFNKKALAITSETANWWHMEHHGAPIDAVDRACFNVIQAYRIIMN